MNPRIRLDEVEARRAEIQSEVAELDALEAPSEDEATRAETLADEFATLTTEAETLRAKVEKLEAVRAAHIDGTHVERGFHAPHVTVKRSAFEGVEGAAFETRAAVRSRALNALEEIQRGAIADGHVDEVARKVETIPGVAEMVLAYGSPAYRSAFEAWMGAQGDASRLVYTPEEAAAVRASMSLTSNAGGYSLPTLLDPSLIHTGTASKQSLRSIARVEQGTQNVWNGVSVGNVTTYWVAENTALTDGTPTFAGPSVTAAKLTAFVTASYEIFEDSMLQAQLPGLIAESMGYAEADAFITGSGSGAPKGIITCLSGTAGVTVTATTRGTFDTGSAVDVFALLNAIPSRYEDGATWVANKATFNKIKQMSTGSNGSYFWSDFNAGIGSPLLGSPILQSSAFSSATTSGTKLIVLGDFSQFLIYDRLGTTVEFIQNVVNGDGLPTGTRGLVAHKRVGSNVTDQNAFRVLNT